MSWMKRRGQTTPSPAPAQPVQMYNPNQHSNQEWPQASANNWYNQPASQNQPKQQYDHNQTNEMQAQQQAYWQQPPYAQQQQSYNQIQPNQYQQNPQQSGYGYQQNALDQQYNSQQYNCIQQQNNMPPYTQPQQSQNSEGDAWNWGWGDEDNSNIQTVDQQTITPMVPILENPIPATNAVTDNISNKWNWNTEGNSTSSLSNYKPDLQSSASSTSNIIESPPTSSIPSNTESDLITEENIFPVMGELAKNHTKSSSPEENFEYKPELSVDNYEMVSLHQLPPMMTGKRGKLMDLTPQWSIESQMSQESSDDVLQTSESDKVLSRSSTISHSPLSGLDPVEPHNAQFGKVIECNKQEFDIIQENKEIIKNETAELINRTPPMPNETPPLQPPSGSNSSDDLKNPFKRTIPHNKRATPPDYISKNYYNPAPFSTTFTQSVNLETLPDNSEDPDIVQAASIIKPTGVPQYPDNNEVAPINDRNQYLETGQLSDGNTNQGIHMEDIGLPPPGFSRMVLGQIEQSGTNMAYISTDNEPPPGLSRMVLGQTESATSVNQPNNGPPAGLHRMIPGESSSPQTRYQNNLEDDYPSESELNQLHRITPQPRSATIGADTPPTVKANRSVTIGANLDMLVPGGAVGFHSERETILDGANTLDVESDPRRDSIEGQPKDIEVHNLVSSVRDLTVGENPTDVATSVTSMGEDRDRNSRQETSDSEPDKSKASHDRRRHKDDKREKERNRDRHTPDFTRDKRDRRRYNRRHDDDTDYLSDGETDKRRDDKRDLNRDDYEKKYSSLRRDKDKRRRDGNQSRDGRRDYHYNRYEDDDGRGSRPTSRSDSIHESYRERGHDRDPRRHRDRDNRDREHRHRDRRHRDPYNASYMQQGYQYDPYNTYYQQQQYQYLENLRRTNPQAYAVWYSKYYQQGQQSGTFVAEDRASVHSGRSSANDELVKERYLRQSYYNQSQSSMSQMAGYYRESANISGQYGLDDSSVSRRFDYTDSSLNLEDTSVVSQRLTPAKFSTAHVKASITSGHLLKIMPHYPLDGPTSTVELVDIKNMLISDDELKELMEFPGPLVKGVTHKKTIIEYCENKIRNANCNDDINDPDSYILMFELLILLLRQNGMVVGTDIAELLMKDRTYDHSLRPSSVASVSNSSGAIENSESSSHGVDSGNGTNLVLKEEAVTDKFREYLLYGSGKEALEWAMKNGLWGHALFLASKLDKRTYANVMMRFANGLPMNDPLQTLYQLLSGRLPASVTSVYDDKWGDWRPHLAMILSNTTQRPELDRKAITTLADTLLSRGSLYAAQFCYLMAEIGFSRYGTDGAKLVLIGSNHNKPFVQFATNEAIHMTEIYEYACSLNDPAFIIPEFQAYKYLLATRLSDRGFFEKSLGYLEKIAGAILRNPPSAQPSLINRVCILAERLKYYDPTEDLDESPGLDGDLDNSRLDNTWLKDLKVIQEEYNMGLIKHESANHLNDATPENDSLQPQQIYSEQSAQDPWQQQLIEQEQYQQQTAQYGQEEINKDTPDYSQQQQPIQEPDYTHYQQENQQYWGQAPAWGDTQITTDTYNSQSQDSPQVEQQHNDYWNNTHTEPDDKLKEPAEHAGKLAEEINGAMFSNTSARMSVFTPGRQHGTASGTSTTQRKPY